MKKEDRLHDEDKGDKTCPNCGFKLKYDEEAGWYCSVYHYPNKRPTEAF